jgi:hypothetical protein
MESNFSILIASEKKFFVLQPIILHLHYSKYYILTTERSAEGLAEVVYIFEFPYYFKEIPCFSFEIQRLNKQRKRDWVSIC